MTREHILVLGLDEVHSIRWQCDACKSALSFSVNEAIQVPQRCPACSAIFVDGNNYSEYESIVKLIQAVKSIHETANRKTLRATVMLEFIDGA
jgi:hypothetical protein